LSAKTVQSIFSLLRKSIREAGGDAWSVKLPKKPRHEVRFFTIDEQKRVESAAKASGFAEYIAVTLCLYTGLRIGEVCGLQYSDIDFIAGTLHVKRTMQRIPNPNGDTKTKITFLSPKSAASERTIPLPDFIMALLLECKTIADCDYVVSLDKKPIEPRTLQNRFKKICQSAELKEVNFHITRHSFAVRALENGFDVKSLSAIMGHANAIITLNHYAHATDTQKRLCMNALSAVYSQT
jgi:integrase